MINRTTIWAHRGASGYMPENTMEAFQMAMEQGVDGIELDVHITKDGEIVVIHDETIDRVSNGLGYVKDYTLQELRKYNFNCNSQKILKAYIPTLREVLELVHHTNVTLNIELKTDIVFYDGIVEKVVSLVEDYQMQNRVWYSSFNHYTLRAIREVCVNAKIGVLYTDGIYRPAEYAKCIQADAIHPVVKNLAYQDAIFECMQNDIKVHVWGVNQYDEYVYCHKKGVDAIITDFPDQAAMLYKRQECGLFPYENPLKFCGVKEFYLFGSGHMGEMFIEKFNSVKLISILDNDCNKWGQMLGEHEVVSPSILKRGDVVIVACVNYKEIIMQILEYGINDYFIFNEAWH